MVDTKSLDPIARMLGNVHFLGNELVSFGILKQVAVGIEGSQEWYLSPNSDFQ